GGNLGGGGFLHKRILRVEPRLPSKTKSFSLEITQFYDRKSKKLTFFWFNDPLKPFFYKEFENCFGFFRLRLAGKMHSCKRYLSENGNVK
ncbi:MAG TPA: hypothetical protein VK859_12105, partial [bacterium]|nr:hypothetical protein [bacterium]